MQICSVYNVMCVYTILYMCIVCVLCVERKVERRRRLIKFCQPSQSGGKFHSVGGIGGGEGG